MNEPITFGPEIRHLMDSKPKWFIQWGISLFLIPLVTILFLIFNIPVRQFEKSGTKIYPTKIIQNTIEQNIVIKFNYPSINNIKIGNLIFLELNNDSIKDVLQGVIKSVNNTSKNNIYELSVGLKIAPRQINKYLKKLLEKKNSSLVVLNVHTISLAKIIGKKILTEN